MDYFWIVQKRGLEEESIGIRCLKDFIQLYCVWSIKSQFQKLQRRKDQFQNGPTLQNKILFWSGFPATSNFSFRKFYFGPTYLQIRRSCHPLRTNGPEWIPSQHRKIPWKNISPLVYWPRLNRV